MSANFQQVSGPGGRVQTLVPSTGPQTFIWNPASLKGTLPGGDFLYADRIRVRVTGNLTNVTTAAQVTPNWQILAQTLGQVRVYSQFLGEMVPKALNSVPLIANHDSFFTNGFGPPTRARGQTSGTSGGSRPIEYEFAIDLKRGYLTRPTDSCPWLPFFEGGIIEIDLAPQSALEAYGWRMTGNWTMEVVIDWFPDKQALIHAAVQSRLYRVITSGPEYLIRGVGSPNGLDGIVQGSRLAILSWLGGGDGSGIGGTGHDNGFYSAFATGGILFATNGITRLDVPFRSQVSIDAVSAWIGSFLAESCPIRHRNQIPDPNQLSNALQNDLAGWPFAMNPSLSQTSQSYVNDALDFWPLTWVGPNDKIADLQKVDGDLSFTATLSSPPAAILHLFRTDEVCAFTAAKAMDLMERMGLPHKARGGKYIYVPKYAGGKGADDSTQFGLPLKIIDPDAR